MELVTSKMCMEKDLGVNHNLFGGNMMAWLDEAAAIFAHEKTHESYMVTVKFDALIFKSPVKERDIVKIFCGNEKVGNTSLTFDVEARIKGRVVCQTTCTFVATTSLGVKKFIGVNALASRFQSGISFPKRNYFSED